MEHHPSSLHRAIPHIPNEIFVLISAKAITSQRIFHTTTEGGIEICLQQWQPQRLAFVCDM